MLNNLSLRLLDLGQPQDALGAINEAVYLGWQLYVTNPDGIRSALAESLANLSKVLEKLDRLQEAHDVVEESRNLKGLPNVEGPSE